MKSSLLVLLACLVSVARAQDPCAVKVSDHPVLANIEGSRHSGRQLRQMLQAPVDSAWRPVVLRGPPGSGKSITISSLRSSLIAVGRPYLYVQVQISAATHAGPFRWEDFSVTSSPTSVSREVVLRRASLARLLTNRPHGRDAPRLMSLIDALPWRSVVLIDFEIVGRGPGSIPFSLDWGLLELLTEFATHGMEREIAIVATFDPHMAPQSSDLLERRLFENRIHFIDFL